MEQFVAFIAIDWSDAKHDICLLDASTSKERTLHPQAHPEELEAWATALRTRCAGQKIAVCLEQSRGPLISALLQYDFLVLYPINPATLAKYRQAFSPSRAKDDPQDADYLLELLCQHRDRLKAWQPENAKTRTLQYLVEHRRCLVNDRTQDQSSDDGTVESLFSAGLPVVLMISALHSSVRFCSRWPTLAAVQKVRPATLERFFHAHNSVRKETLRPAHGCYQSGGAFDHRSGGAALLRPHDQSLRDTDAGHHRSHPELGPRDCGRLSYA